MVLLLSSQSTYFKTPQDVQVADMTFGNVLTHDVREIIDNDGVRKTVNHLDGEKSQIVSYVIDNKVVRAEEHFNTRETMRLGDRVYSGVISRTIIPGKYSTYTVVSPTSIENKIRVRQNGAVLDIGELMNKVLIRKMKQPFVRMAQALH